MRVYYLDPFTECICACVDICVHAFTYAVRAVVVGTAAGIVESLKWTRVAQ